MAIVTLPTIGADPVSITSSVLNGKVDPLATDYNGNIQNVNIASGAGIVYSKLSLTDSILNADINSAAAIAASKINLGTIAQDINEAKGADVASAGTTTIWVTDGNFIHITGTTTITSFGTAPQAGAERTVVFDGALTLTHNATSLILPTGANITTAAGDVAVVRAETTANARVVNYYRKDGTALSGGVTVASQAEMEAATDVAKAVTPGRTVFHPGVAKGWCTLNGTGTIAVLESYNVTSIADNGTGYYTVTWDTDFATADYAVSGSAKVDTADTNADIPAFGLRRIGTNPAVGAVKIQLQDNGGSALDGQYVAVIAWGDR